MLIEFNRSSEARGAGYSDADGKIKPESANRSDARENLADREAKFRLYHEAIAKAPNVKSVEVLYYLIKDLLGDDFLWYAGAENEADLRLKAMKPGFMEKVLDNFAHQMVAVEDEEFRPLYFGLKDAVARRLEEGFDAPRVLKLAA